MLVHKLMLKTVACEQAPQCGHRATGEPVCKLACWHFVMQMLQPWKRLLLHTCFRTQAWYVAKSRVWDQTETRNLSQNKLNSLKKYLAVKHSLKSRFMLNSFYLVGTGWKSAITCVSSFAVGLLSVQLSEPGSFWMGYNIRDRYFHFRSVLSLICML